MNVTVGVPIWGGLAIAGLAVLVIVIALLFSRRGRIALGVIAAVVVIALFLGYVVTQPSSTQSEVMIRELAQLELRQPQPAPGWAQRQRAEVATNRTTVASPPEWLPDRDMLATADVQASQDQAMEALAARIVEAGPAVTNNGWPPSNILIKVPNPIPGPSLAAKLAARFDGLERPTITEVNGQASSQPPDGIVVDLTQNVTRRQSGTGTTVSGQLSAAVRGLVGSRSVSVRFDERQWNSDLNAFLGRQSHQQWVVGRSSAPATSSAEAQQQAFAAAARQLRPMLLQRVYITDGDASALQARLESQVRSWATDQFIQSFNRPYGTVWRASVLVDANNNRLASFANEYQNGVRTASHIVQTRRLSAVASAAALVLLTFLVYLFLNTVTKGYFTNRLRATAIVLAAVGTVTVLIVFLA